MLFGAPRKLTRLTGWLMVMALVLSLAACDTVGYYTQAVQGQATVLLKRQPIDRLLRDPQLESDLRHKLTVIVQAREFAEQSLGLPAQGSYRSYVALERQHMVWNVFAAPAFDTTLRTWCFPVAGCVAYRGYFSEASAHAYAERLQEQGYDVYVGGVDAYSTLGWFNDPVPSTIMRRSDYRLAGLVFHELAHQRLYVPGDTAFNESFASFVEQEGLRRWLAESGETQFYAMYQQEVGQQQEFVELVTDYRHRFNELYSRDMSPDQMQLEKQMLQQAMRDDWQQRDGLRAYAGWFAGPLNNAQLGTVGAYHDWVPAFAAMLDEAGGDLPRFYDRVAALSALPAEQRRAELAALQPQT